MARGEEGKVLNIKLSGDTGAHIPVKLNGIKVSSFNRHWHLSELYELRPV